MEQVEFHTSVMGFNKTEVLDYVSKMAKEKDDAVEEMEKKLDELAEQSEDIKKRLEQELFEKNQKIEDLSREREELIKKAEEFCSKEKVYDSAIESVGAAMLKVRETSDSLLEEAKERIGFALTKFSKTKEKASTEVILLRKLLENTKTTVNEAVVSFGRQLRDALNSLEDVQKNLDEVELADGDFCFSEEEEATPA